MDGDDYIAHLDDELHDIYDSPAVPKHMPYAQSPKVILFICVGIVLTSFVLIGMLTLVCLGVVGSMYLAYTFWTGDPYLSATVTLIIVVVVLAVLILSVVFGYLLYKRSVYRNYVRLEVDGVPPPIPAGFK